MTEAALKEIEDRWRNRNKGGEAHEQFRAYCGEDISRLLAECRRSRDRWAKVDDMLARFNEVCRANPEIGRAIGNAPLPPPPPAKGEE